MMVFRRLLRDRSALLGLIILVTLIVVAIFAYPLATFPQDVTSYDPPHRLLPPSMTYWFGTDRMGGDIYSRLLFGARLTILIAVVATSVSVLVGVPVGLLAGYYNNRLSDLLMRISDIFLAVPQIVLA
ncbi:MAG TPA: D,D-dipeptide ABC transporter permease, partial [Acetobacteraceae bacterium]|nr:D,D-dipeptide ABC transporter permease [Acetobacteraceae bacterium]